MTDITELAQLRGRTVDYPYYLVECDCGKIYPSSELSGGEPMGDSGDYSDCYCPHCGEGEEHFAECADPETAWKAQQDKIDAVVEALEKAQRANAAQDDHINQQQDRINKLEEGCKRAAKRINSWRRLAKQSIAEQEKCVDELDATRQRIVELDRKNCELDSLTQRWAVERAENAERIAELESRTVTVHQSDYFTSLVAMARVSADKAMRKFPQPNYVLLKVAEEAGEVVQAGVHYAENRMEWGQVEGEIVQLLAMLIRLVTEGDQVNGITPPASCSTGIKVEAE
ncbi:hypothetical protein [Klebsiella pneumoniae]|uniref:hypothetical protein n=1 Tax=Klebsiella pneumoniae TaxID=573 RepID=UPI002DBE5716|nr:hypothetical protein [Klebsiella pneumoniae]MEB5845924.1 hypothetical protein [Klebsiella pneumoniae]